MNRKWATLCYLFPCNPIISHSMNNRKWATPYCLLLKCFGLWPMIEGMWQCTVFHQAISLWLMIWTNRMCVTLTNLSQHILYYVKDRVSDQAAVFFRNSQHTLSNDQQQVGDNLMCFCRQPNNISTQRVSDTALFSTSQSLHIYPIPCTWTACKWHWSCLLYPISSYDWQGVSDNTLSLASYDMLHWPIESGWHHFVSSFNMSTNTMIHITGCEQYCSCHCW